MPLLKETRLNLAGQNMYTHDKGAFTGQISALSLIDAQCRYVLLGHSEPRRIFGEQDELIRQKLLKALDHKILPVLCVGETARERELGQTKEILHQQLAGSLKGLTTSQMKQIVIASWLQELMKTKFENKNSHLITNGINTEHFYNRNKKFNKPPRLLLMYHNIEWKGFS